LLLLLSGCGLSFKSRADKPDAQKVYVYGSACHEQEQEAKTLALSDLIQYSSLPILKDFQTFQRVDGDKAFCYHATVGRVEWGQYSKALSKEKATLQALVSELNNTIYYSEKSIVIDEILQEQGRFNRQLQASLKIAPVSLTPFDLNRTRIETDLNARPSIKMDYMPCSRRSNYRCQLGFISKVKDESQDISYVWTFGDGSRSVHRNPLYTYTSEGDFNVTLRVEDPLGAYSVVSTVVKVKALERPFAYFKTKKRQYKQGDAVLFHNGSYTQKGKLTSYRWSFGDGKHSFRRSPVHHFSAPGRYDVVLKVCNSLGHCSSLSKQLTIIEDDTAIDTKKGVPIKDYIAQHGPADAQIVKEKALMSAYLYDGIWLLAKRGKIECAVKEKGLVTNLLGQPKKCYWHEKHSKQYMVKLK